MSEQIPGWPRYRKFPHQRIPRATSDDVRCQAQGDAVLCLISQTLSHDCMTPRKKKRYVGMDSSYLCESRAGFLTTRVSLSTAQALPQHHARALARKAFWCQSALPILCTRPNCPMLCTVGLQGGGRTRCNPSFQREALILEKCVALVFLPFSTP